MDMYLNKDATFEDLNIQRCERLDGTFLLMGKIRLKREPSVSQWAFSECLTPSSDKHEWDGAKGFSYKLRKASSEYQVRKGNNRYHLCIHIIVGPLARSKKGSGKYFCSTSTIRVHGFLGELLEDLDKEKFKLKLQIGIQNHNKNSHAQFTSKLIFADIPISSKEALGPIDGSVCIQNEKYFETTHNDGYIFQHYDNKVISGLRGSINVILSREGTRTQSDWPDKFGIHRDILENQIHTDVLLVASNGEELACNKSILAAHSPVFGAMFRTTMMEEAKTNKVEIDDMSEDAVRALLAYLYGWDLRAPLEKSGIALELLKAAHKYDISHLETDAKKIFDNKPAIWCDVEVGLELFLFVRKLSGCDDLKRKAVDVLTLKAADMTMESFNELLDGKPQFKGLDIDLLFDALQIKCLKKHEEQQ